MKPFSLLRGIEGTNESSLESEDEYMPKLQPWEEKAIGRAARFQNTPYEYFISILGQAGRQIVMPAINAVAGTAEQKTRDFFTVRKPVTINGKEFSEKYTLGQKIGYSIAANAGTVFTSGAQMIDKYINRGYFYPDGKMVADAAFSGRVNFDAEMGRQMFNTCGYKPNFKQIMQQLRDITSTVDNSLTDISWRKGLTPHILRTVFQDEMKQMLSSIRESHQNHPEIYSHQLMQAHMRKATWLLSDIFEKFTVDLANNTDYLEAPMSLLPKNAPTLADADLTDDERQMWADVAHHSLFENEQQMQQLIDGEMKKLPNRDAQDVWEKFRFDLRKPLNDPKLGSSPYECGKDRVEDQRRLNIAVLNLRELQQQYESRNFFSRWFTAAGRAERNAIRNMQDYLCATLDLVPEQLQTMLDPKTPFEESVDLKQAMHLKYEPQPEPQPEPPLISEETQEMLVNAGKKVVETIEVIGAAVSDGAVKIVNEAKEIINDIAQNGIENPIALNDDFSKDLNFMDDDLADIWGLNGSNNQQPIPQPEEKKEENKVNEQPEEVKANEQEEVKADEQQVENKVDEQQKPNEVDEQKVQNEPEEKEPEYSAAAEFQPSHVYEAPAESSGGMFNTLASGASYVASFFNFSSYFSSSTPLQQVQNKQKEVANQLKGNQLDRVKAQPALAKLLYFKTLEISFEEKKITADQLTASLSDKAVNEGVELITKDPAFQQTKLYKLIGENNAPIAAQYYKGFMEKASADPAIVREFHVDYLQKREMIKQQEAQMQNAPQKAPEKENPSASDPQPHP